MKTVKIRRYPATRGCYGERYDVNSKDEEVYNFFKAICIWTTDAKVEEDWSTTLTFELPFGETYESNTLLRLALERLNCEIVS